jgi:hypothetical protein
MATPEIKAKLVLMTEGGSIGNTQKNKITQEERRFKLEEFKANRTTSSFLPLMAAGFTKAGLAAMGSAIAIALADKAFGKAPLPPHLQPENKGKDIIDQAKDDIRDVIDRTKRRVVDVIKNPEKTLDKFAKGLEEFANKTERHVDKTKKIFDIKEGTIEKEFSLLSSTTQALNSNAGRILLGLGPVGFAFIGTMIGTAEAADKLGKAVDGLAVFIRKTTGSTQTGGASSSTPIRDVTDRNFSVSRLPGGRTRYGGVGKSPDGASRFQRVNIKSIK